MDCGACIRISMRFLKAPHIKTAASKTPKLIGLVAPEEEQTSSLLIMDSGHLCNQPATAGYYGNTEKTVTYRFEWWPEVESNHRHEDFQSTALPTELSGQLGVRIKAADLHRVKPEARQSGNQSPQNTL